ncbi:MAG: hypothetical protein R6W68_12680 [Ignavibacteriaceae bacterium]
MKIFNVVLSVFLLFTLFFFLVSCSGSSCCKDNTDTTSIPQDIFEKGNRFIISKTGADFFNKYIQPDFLISKELSSGYFLAYNFNMPEKPFVNGTIRFSVDSTGKILTDREVAGIPNCIHSPGKCDFLIDEINAAKIAKQSGLESGIKEWDIKFLWNAQFNQYVWHVINTLQESEGGYGRRANGIEMIIDPNSGEVLATNEWRVN